MTCESYLAFEVLVVSVGATAAATPLLFRRCEASLALKFLTRRHMSSRSVQSTPLAAPIVVGAVVDSISNCSRCSRTILSTTDCATPVTVVFSANCSRGMRHSSWLTSPSPLKEHTCERQSATDREKMTTNWKEGSSATELISGSARTGSAFADLQE